MKSCVKLIAAAAALALALSAAGCKKKEEKPAKPAEETRPGKKDTGVKPADVKHGRFIPAGAVVYGVFSGKELMDAARPLLDAVAKKEGKASAQVALDKVKKAIGIDLNGIKQVTLIGLSPRKIRGKRVRMFNFAAPVFLVDAAAFAKGERKPVKQVHGLPVYKLKGPFAATVTGGLLLVGPMPALETVMAAATGKGPRMKGDAKLIALTKRMRQRGGADAAFVVVDVATGAERFKSAGVKVGKFATFVKAAAAFWKAGKYGAIILEGDETVLKAMAAKAKAGMAEGKAEWTKVRPQIAKALGPGVESYLKAVDGVFGKISLKTEKNVLTLRLNAPPLKILSLGFGTFMIRAEKAPVGRDAKAAPVAPPRAAEPRPAVKVKKPAKKFRRKSARPARPE